MIEKSTNIFKFPSSQQQTMVCTSLNELIEDCTVILGWCYTSEDVQITKEKQRGLLNKAMKKIFP